MKLDKGVAMCFRERRSPSDADAVNFPTDVCTFLLRVEQRFPD